MSKEQAEQAEQTEKEADAMATQTAEQGVEETVDQAEDAENKGTAQDDQTESD